MNDKIGRTIRRGQTIAIGKRSGDSGALDIGVVAEVLDHRISVFYTHARWSFQDDPAKPRRGSCSDSSRILIIDALERNEHTESLLDLRDDMRGDN